MRKTVQARLNLESGAVREGLRLLDSCHSRRAAKRIVGLGKFDSGVPDLGSNKKHLEGLTRAAPRR